MIILIVIFHISYVKATTCLVAFPCNVTGRIAIFHVCISGCMAPLAPPAPLAPYPRFYTTHVVINHGGSRGRARHMTPPHEVHAPPTGNPASATVN